MRTISWKQSVAALFAIAIFAACSSDTTPPSTDGGTDAGSTCGNKKVDKNEDCDGTTTKKCSDATMGKMTSGTLSCTSKCKFDISKCTSGAGGSGGGGGMGTGGVSNGGTGGGPSGGKDAGGPDAGAPGSGGTPAKTDSGTKTDGGSTKVPDAAPAPVDAAAKG